MDTSVKKYSAGDLCKFIWNDKYEYDSYYLWDNSKEIFETQNYKNTIFLSEVKNDTFSFVKIFFKRTRYVILYNINKNHHVCLSKRFVSKNFKKI